jgi:hypothetical protein
VLPESIKQEGIVCEATVTRTTQISTVQLVLFWFQTDHSD